jgi:hypothetical protein
MIHYYIKSLSKKVILPLALVASSLTPALAGNTTLKIQGPEGDKIAFDETKQVELMMQSTGDNVSFVEVNIDLPAGLEYVEGSFAKADIEALKTHQYKVTMTPKGFHVAIYSDNLVSMGDMADFTTIGTFDVKANTKLTGDGNIEVTIVDLTDKDAQQIDYNNIGVNPETSVDEEGAPGDNSLGSATVAIDKSKFPGEWKVYTVADLNADGNLEFNPLFDKKTISVALKNDIAQISGLEFQLILPVGLTLDVESLKENLERKVGQSVGSQIIVNKETGETTNDYKIFYLGGDKPFNLHDGDLLTFDVTADLSLAHTEDFTDIITLNNIILTDIYSVAVKHENLTIKVFNPNEKAKFELTNALDVLEAWAANEPYSRVYDYKKVLDARTNTNAELADRYNKGILGYQENPAEVQGLIDGYKAQIEESAEANEKLYKDGLDKAQALQEQLDAENQPQVINDSRSTNRANAEDRESLFPLEEFIDPALQVAYDAAKDAIDAFGAKVQELYDQQTEVDPAKYDGALLADQDKGDASEIAALQKAAEDAIAAFIAKRNEINENNHNSLLGIVNESLIPALNQVVKYVENLPYDDSGTLTGAYANWENFPEIKEAIDKAQAAIDELLSENGPIEVGYNTIALPYEEGIVPVLDDFVDAFYLIRDVIDIADQAKADNDAAYKDLTAEFLELVSNPENLYGGWDGLDQEALALLPQTYQDAYHAVNEVVKAYYDELQKSNQEGMVAKNLANEDSELNATKAAAEEAIQQFQTVVDNLTDLNALMDQAESDLQEAYDELERITSDYEFMEEGIYTEELIDDILKKIDDASKELVAIDGEVNKAEDWTDLLNEEGEVDAWKERLQKLLDDINNGIDQDIINAEETYIYYHKLGDANMDGVVSTTDYVEIMNYVLMKTEYGEKYGTMPADASEDQKVREKFSQLNVSAEDGDKKINVTDAVALINLLSYGDIHGAAGARAFDISAQVNTKESMTNGVRRIALLLNNSQAMVAGQFDVRLPEGMKLVGAQLATRANGHNLDSNILSDGSVRFAIASTDNTAFEGNEGAVVYIDVEGAGEVQFENIEFVTDNAFGMELELGAQATAINGINADENNEQVYSLSGRMMNTLKKGINIIRRADGKTEKVIKK